MRATQQTNRRSTKEVWFQVILIAVLFLATVFDKRKPEANLWEFVFFTNYILAALFISYLLLPRYFYKRKYIQFTIWVTVLLMLVCLIEEFVLEKLFFPDTRGNFFPGILPTLLDVLPVILIMVGFKFGFDAQRKQTELERLNTVVAESRLQFLKSQINPHFLFNNLNNLYAYALENSPKTPGIILELSSLLRYMLYDCQESKVPLEKEIQCLQDFIRLQKLQIEDRGDITFTISGEQEGHFIAPLILIVFVENCFKHSTASQTKGIRINIALEITEGRLKMQCSNTFSSNANVQELSKGIGLDNVKSRLALLYPNAHVLNIDNKDDVFTVDLELNLIK
ncbi:histidine kinase [Fulvivirgaceae bacterium BMA12]|uniref:Histidine kinase n=1 Tax=Agaribacillus aureus TaxID=3051825 RepID=A0ABT8LEG2_9BACT|nr:histidine kinase [Fulvivirgaceae bacterium BMA12]